MTRRDPILETFDATLAKRPAAAPLLVCRGAAWTARELSAAADELAASELCAAVRDGGILGLSARGPAFLIGYLAVRRRGGVPILLDGGPATPDTLATLERLGAQALLACTDDWPDGLAPWSRRELGGQRRPLLDPTWGAIKLTSGSTGAPRGVAVRGAALLADDAQLARSMGLRADDRFVAAVPLAHSYGFSSLALPALVRGSTLLFPPAGDPLGALTIAREGEGTVLPTIPAWLAGYVRLTSPPRLAASVRLVLAAGAPLAPEVARAFRERTGRAVHVFYGASECGGIAFDRRGDAAERGTVGEPVDGVSLAIDATSGRLQVRSAALADTYLPEPSPNLTGERFATGDRAELDGGEVRLLGRVDDLVIVRGKNVDPREVEGVLGQLAGVDDCVVFGADGPDGPNSQLVAAIASHGTIDRRELVERLRGRLAPHKVPRRLLLLSELPRTERGKLDRRALVDALEGGSSEPTPGGD